jgi:hypothetical protein
LIHDEVGSKPPAACRLIYIVVDVPVNHIRDTYLDLVSLSSNMVLSV